LLSFIILPSYFGIPMTRRTRAREVVLQLLYQHDQNANMTLEDVRQFFRRRLRDDALEKWADELYGGALTHKTEIDRRLSEIAENWRIDRMAVVDRNILRLGVYELLHCPETPANVTINEAVELAKRYGTVDSPAFVNGLLDRLASSRPQAPSVPSPPSTEE
jgi:N utilization substance protein B